MNVLLINDAPTDLDWINPNWGGRAAAAALKMMIRGAGGTIAETINEYEIEHSSFGHSDTRSRREIIKPFIPPVALKLRRKLVRNPDTTSESELVPRKWGEYRENSATIMGKDSPWPRLFNLFERVDLVVINGDGDIYGNTLHARTLLFLGFLVKRHFNTPVIMVNHTADFGHPDLLEVARHVYPLFDDVVFRDHVSVDRCGTFCEGRLAADTAFWFEPAAREAWAALAGRPTYFDIWPDSGSFDPTTPYLCVGGSAALATVADGDRIVHGYTELLGHLRSVYTGQIVLTASDVMEQKIFRPLAGRLGLPLIGLTTPVQQAVDVLGNADAYVGGRWHPSIFALRGGAPVIPLASHTFKMQALTDMAGLRSAARDPLHLDRETVAIGRSLLSYLEQGDEVRSRLRSWAGDMARSSWGNVGYLGGAITDRPRGSL